MQGLRGLARRMGQGVASRGGDKGGWGWRGARPSRRRRPHSELKGRSAAPGAGEGGCEGGGSGFSLAASFSHTVQSVPTCSPAEQKHQAETKGISKGRGRCLNPAPKRLPGDGRSPFSSSAFPSRGSQGAEKSPGTSSPVSPPRRTPPRDAADPAGCTEPGATQVVPGRIRPRKCPRGHRRPGATRMLEGRRWQGAREKDRFSYTAGLGKFALLKCAKATSASTAAWQSCAGWGGR